MWQIVERQTRDTLGEGVTWCARDGALYWVDILAPALNRLVLATGRMDRWDTDEPIGWVVPDGQGGLIGGFRSGIAQIVLDPFAAGPRRAIEPHLPGNRMNDGKTDPKGALWFGTMDMDGAETAGALYRLSTDGQLQVMDAGYIVPNGPAFSPCGQWFYHADSGLGLIYRYAIEGDACRRAGVFATFGEGEGCPDGMTTDADGFLWVAHWDGGAISRFASDGTLDRRIALPARRITNIAFAGPALDRMFVTSASLDLPVSEFDGALFEVESGATGVPPLLYAGVLG